MADRDSPEDEFDSLDLEEIGEKSLWILTGKKGEVKESLHSLRGSRSQRAKLELEAFKRENEDLKKQVELARHAREDREAELRQKEEQITGLTQQLQAAKIDAESQASDLYQKLAKKDDELKSLEDKNATLQKEIGDLKGQIQIKNTVVKDLGQKASTHEGEKEQLARKVNELKEQLQKMQQTKSGDDKTKKAEIDRLTAEVGDLKRQLQSKNVQVIELNQQASTRGEEKNQLAKEAERLKGELHKMQQTRNDDSKTKRAEIDRLTKEIGDLRGQLQIKNAQVEDLKQLASTRGEEKEQLVTETKQLQGQLLKMQRASTSSTDDNEANVAKIKQLTKQLSTQAKGNEQKKREIEQLKQDLACAQENIAELMGASGGVRASRPDPKATTVDIKASDTNHTCPVCQKTLRVSQAEFERHVNSHFN